MDNSPVESPQPSDQDSYEASMKAWRESFEEAKTVIKELREYLEAARGMTIRGEKGEFLLSGEIQRELDTSFAAPALGSPTVMEAAGHFIQSFSAASKILIAIDSALPGARIVDKTITRDGLITLVILPDQEAYLEATGVLKPRGAPEGQGSSNAATQVVAEPKEEVIIRPRKKELKVDGGHS